MRLVKNYVEEEERWMEMFERKSLFRFMDEEDRVN